MPTTNAQTLFEHLLNRINIYEKPEAKEIVFWLLEHFMGLRKIDVLSNKPIDNELIIDWTNLISRINSHEPIQYILGETEFYGRKFWVNENVLIPRPETEELVKYIADFSKNCSHKKILDIGTGSGCIAVSLAAELPDFQVYAYDISEKALEIAQKNAILNRTSVQFEKQDILQLAQHNNQQPAFGVIVSNPPYVTKSEIQAMRRNVVDFEPHLALFVEDENPLIFYEAIAKFSRNALITNGLLVTEINEKLGSETAQVFERNGFQAIEIMKDIQRKDRFLKGILQRN